MVDDRERRRQLIEAIRDADHGDDAPYLVYADWLLERGDPRGPLAVLQMRQRDPAHSSAVNAARIQAILGDEGAILAGPWRDVAERFTFSRGLLAQLVVPIDAFVATARTLLDREPGEIPDELAHLTWIDLLPPVDASELHRLVAAFEALVREARLPLTWLRLRFPFDPIIARMLGDSAIAARLIGIAIAGAPAPPAALAQLLRGSYLDGLLALELCECGLDDTGADAMIQTPRWEQIRALQLSGEHHPITEDGATRMARAGASWSRLEARYLPVDTRFTSTLARDARRLADLDLSHSAITAAGVRALASMPNLVLVKLKHTNITDDAIESFLGMSRLESLQLQGTDVTSAGAVELLRRGPPSLARLGLPFHAARDLDPKLLAALEERFVLAFG